MKKTSLNWWTITIKPNECSLSSISYIVFIGLPSTIKVCFSYYRFYLSSTFWVSTKTALLVSVPIGRLGGRLIEISMDVPAWLSLIPAGRPWPTPRRPPRITLLSLHLISGFFLDSKRNYCYISVKIVAQITTHYSNIRISCSLALLKRSVTLKILR